MKLRNNYNVGDRILILHTNTKNQLRKDDVGKIGTILDKRCSFCVVHLDGDDRDKNYNYGTFAKITKCYVSLSGGLCTLAKALEKEVPFDTVEEALVYAEKDCAQFIIGNATTHNILYDKRIPAWRGNIVAPMDGCDVPQSIGFIRFDINEKLNVKFPENN